MNQDQRSAEPIRCISLVRVGCTSKLSRRVGLMLPHSDSGAIQFLESRVGLNSHMIPPSLPAYDVHVEDGHEAVPRLFKNLVIVCVVENQKPRFLLLIAFKDRQLDHQSQCVGLYVLYDSMKLRVVNVYFGDLHAGIRA